MIHVMINCNVNTSVYAALDTSLVNVRDVFASYYAALYIYCNVLFTRSTLIVYCHSLLTRSTLIVYCHSLLTSSTLIVYCHALLTRSTSIVYCHAC